MEPLKTLSFYFDTILLEIAEDINHTPFLSLCSFPSQKSLVLSIKKKKMSECYRNGSDFVLLENQVEISALSLKSYASLGKLNISEFISKTGIDCSVVRMKTQML